MSDSEALLLTTIVAESPLLSRVLNAWDRLALPDCWLAGGAIAQTVWNHRFGLPPGHGIDDIDIVYFDAADLSETMEAQHAARIRGAFADLPIRIDVKNEARVHLWYEARFNYPIRPYISAADAISAFPTTATTVGVQPGDDYLRLCAPYGIADLLQPIVRPNKRQITHEIYSAKISRWAAAWPKLQIVGWNDLQALSS